MVTPSGAVTTVLITFGPTTSGNAADAAPEATIFPFTFTVAPVLLVVGVTVIEAVALLTEAGCGCAVSDGLWWWL